MDKTKGNGMTTATENSWDVRNIFTTLTSIFSGICWCDEKQSNDGKKGANFKRKKGFSLGNGRENFHQENQFNLSLGLHLPSSHFWWKTFSFSFVIAEMIKNEGGGGGEIIEVERKWNDKENEENPALSWMLCWWIFINIKNKNHHAALLNSIKFIVPEAYHHISVRMCSHLTVKSFCCWISWIMQGKYWAWKKL